jgi:hypothetical protein
MEGVSGVVVGAKHHAGPAAGAIADSAQEGTLRTVGALAERDLHLAAVTQCAGRMAIAASSGLPRSRRERGK